jgi:hypothetical protein
MKFATTAVMALLLAEQTSAFSTFTPIKTNYKSSSSSSSSSLSMAIDMPPAEATTVVNTVAESSTPIITKSTYGPTDVRYSDFLKLVDGNKIEKVTFSADGTQLLGVDVDGTRLKIESLPNDPELLSQLTGHKVRVLCVFVLCFVCRHQSYTMQYAIRFDSIWAKNTFSPVCCIAVIFIWLTLSVVCF